MRKFHCVFCGRSCCSNCSDETLPELKLIDQELVPTVDKPLQNIANFFAKSQQKQQAAKVCEYCFVKITNPQLEAFYQLGKLWRQKDEETIEQKIQWYKDSSQELLDQCEVEREGMLLDIEANERDLKKISNSKIQLTDQREYIFNEKKNMEAELGDLQTQRDALKAKVELLRRKKQDLAF